MYLLICKVVGESQQKLHYLASVLFFCLLVCFKLCFPRMCKYQVVLSDCGKRFQIKSVLSGFSLPPILLVTRFTCGRVF